MDRCVEYVYSAPLTSRMYYGPSPVIARNGQKKKSHLGQPDGVALKEVAALVGLAPGTVSAVLNGASSSRAIPERTRQRINAAAKTAAIICILRNSRT
jgi:hypothetical protein